MCIKHSPDACFPGAGELGLAWIERATPSFRQDWFPRSVASSEPSVSQGESADLMLRSGIISLESPGDPVLSPRPFPPHLSLREERQTELSAGIWSAHVAGGKLQETTLSQQVIKPSVYSLLTFSEKQSWQSLQGAASICSKVFPQSSKVLSPLWHWSCFGGGGAGLCGVLAMQRPGTPLLALFVCHT